MAVIPMIQPITVDTAKRYASNAGMIVFDLDTSKLTDAATLMAAVKAAPEKWLGATSGNTSIGDGRKNWSPSHNGKRVPWVGDMHLDTAAPFIKAKVVEMKESAIQRMAGTADVSGTGTKVITIKPKADYDVSDYKTVHWLTNLGADGVILVTLKNALCVSGLNWSIDDKKIATADVEFVAHASDPTDTEYLPMECQLYLAAAT